MYKNKYFKEKNYYNINFWFLYYNYLALYEKICIYNELNYALFMQI